MPDLMHDIEDAEGIEATVVKPVRDEGSVVLFEATAQNDSGEVRLTFACDHRSAQDLVDALAAGEEPVVYLEDWQIVYLEDWQIVGLR